MQSLGAGAGMGAILSVCIRLNLKAQNKYKSAPSSASNWIQSITYLGSMLIGLPAIFFLATFSTDYLNESPIHTALFIFGSISLIVWAFRSGFIPKDKTRSDSRAK